MRIGNGEQSPRQELSNYVEEGRLRDAIMDKGDMSEEAVDLLITVVRRYCEPRRRRSTLRGEVSGG